MHTSHLTVAPRSIPIAGVSCMSAITMRFAQLPTLVEIRLPPSLNASFVYPFGDDPVTAIKL